ncbi:uncharacterized protein TNCV_3658081 [Trichonephila clavipes]|nr:uncharacterized protein TNCV_3658081 [Trichonephila clavipes]
MAVCKRIVPSWPGGTVNSPRAANHLVRLVEGEERWETPDHLQGVLPQNWGEIKRNHSVPCMSLKATDNDRRHLALCHDEFRGLDLAFADRVSIKKWASLISLLKEDETDQAIEEPDEIMHINRDSESKYDKSDRHETFELNCNFQMLPKELYQEN